MTLDGDYELEDAIIKREDNHQTPTSVDSLPPFLSGGFFDDDGNEINMDLIKKPGLCLTRALLNNPHEELLCNMTRHDQKDEEEFICHAFRKKIF